MDRISREKIKNVVATPNLGLMSIASVLMMHGYHVKIMDFFVEEISPNQFVNRVLEYKPDVIGFSVYTRTVPFLEKIVKLLLKMRISVITVAGGPHATFAPEEMLQQYHIDYVLRGEGEFSFLKLMEHLNYPNAFSEDKVKGLSYISKDKIIHNTTQPFIENLDALPLQPIGLIEDKNYTSIFTLITSRGCPGNCIYCSSRALSGYEYRMRSAENIICEIGYLSKKLRDKKFIILDDTFTANIARFEQFITLLNKMNGQFEYRIESRGDALSMERLNSLKNSNCKVIHVGIESGSQEVIKKIGKNINLEDTVNLLIYGQEIGIHMVASFIIGHYCDTKETIEETIALMKRLRTNGIETSIASCTPFPGTPLYENKEKLEVIIHSSSWQDYDFGNVIISTKYLTSEEIRKYLYEAILVSMN